MADLPYDLWIRVVHFLSREDVWTLRSVNRILFNIAMDDHYQFISINFDLWQNDGHYVAHFRHLAEPHIASRIRKLSFRHFRWFNELEVKASSKRTSFSLVKRRLMGSIRNELKTVIDVITQFSKLSSLHVQWSSSYDLRTFLRCMPPILHACWGAFAGSLRSVSLDIPIELLHEVVPKVVLRRLESLSLSFYALPGADNSELLFSDAVRTNILPFLNNHTRSLQTMELSLRTAGSWMHPSIFRGGQFDFGPLFKGLYYVPHLNSLALDITPSTSISSVSRLLKSHVNTLHTLAISAIDFHGDPLEHLLQEALVPLPYLINLTINFDLSEGPISSGTLNEYLKQYMPTLTSLKLLRKLNQTGDILQMFNQNSGCFLGNSPLKNLNITIECLTPGILDLAAAGLPNLHNTHHMNPRNEEYEFCLEMARRKYSGWALRHLEVNFRKILFFEKGNQCIAAIAEALPGLQTLNGVTRLE